jgi:hypothetical protein
MQEFCFDTYKREASALRLTDCQEKAGSCPNKMLALYIDWWDLIFSQRWRLLRSRCMSIFYVMYSCRFVGGMCQNVRRAIQHVFVWCFLFSCYTEIRQCFIYWTMPSLQNSQGRQDVIAWEMNEKHGFVQWAVLSNDLDVINAVSQHFVTWLLIDKQLYRQTSVTWQKGRERALQVALVYMMSADIVYIIFVHRPYMWDFRFSRRRVWRWVSSGM